MPGRTPYRPSSSSRRINHAVARLAALGLTPANTVALEVVGRRSGRRRATAVVTTTHDQARYVVSLAGESDWVRNVRAGVDPAPPDRGGAPGRGTRTSALRSWPPTCGNER